MNNLFLFILINLLQSLSIIKNDSKYKSTFIYKMLDNNFTTNF